jgi:ABC-2 type transport system ATP-binding protein
MIRVQDFHKTYQQTVAVSGLSFEVLPGQVLGLLGPNGAGKTTTLRALAGILPPTRGSLAIAGNNLAADPLAAKSQLAYIPDDPHLFDALTVFEHLMFIASAYRLADWKSEAEKLLEDAELTEKRNAPAQELSRGMRQKLAICCAYLHNPKAILFDEPLTGLDPRGIRTIKQSIRERALAGSAIIVSSHLLALVEDVCTHLLIIHKGRQLFFGQAKEAHQAYSDMPPEASLEELFFRATEGPTTSPGGDKT